MSDRSFATLVLGYIARTQPPLERRSRAHARHGFLAQLRDALAFEPTDIARDEVLSAPRVSSVEVTAPYPLLLDATGVDLQGADLARRKLSQYVFVGANLESANLHRAYLGAWT
ncbi:pentapeptide repeat-containing protein [Streptomyces sp. NBC_01613]